MRGSDNVRARCYKWVQVNCGPWKAIVQPSGGKALNVQCFAVRRSRQCEKRGRTYSWW